MGMIQLVERDDSPDHHVLQYRENPESASFVEFEREGFHAVLWGGPDLIAVAAALRERGYRVTAALITDAHNDLLDDEFRAEIVDLVNEGAVPEALKLLSNRYFDAFVQAVTVASLRDRAQFRLMQFGRVEPVGQSDPDTLIAALSRT
ncbi:hypothetical protein [Curtobacterium flaccumfaciens]|uniref:hypothetical protein n=1 Tax=Curtobacterium flaccumfaciens TaxID=2035 RepID=UPI001125E569|nr:hypothetical protein [Curtobacterium flaccumfaciens]